MYLFIYLFCFYLIGPNGATNQRAVDAGRQQVQLAGVCPGRPALPCPALPCLSPQTDKQKDTIVALIYRMPSIFKVWHHRSSSCLVIHIT